VQPQSQVFCCNHNSAVDITEEKLSFRGKRILIKINKVRMVQGSTCRYSLRWIVHEHHLFIEPTQTMSFSKWQKHFIITGQWHSNATSCLVNSTTGCLNKNGSPKVFHHFFHNHLKFWGQNLMRLPVLGKHCYMRVPCSLKICLYLKLQYLSVKVTSVFFWSQNVHPYLCVLKMWSQLQKMTSVWLVT